MNDLRVEIKLRNNILYNLIFDNYSSVSEFSRVSGFGEVTIGKYLNLKCSPLGINKQYTKTVRGIASFFKLLEEDIFPLDLYNIKINSGAFEINSNLLCMPINPEDKMLNGIENKDLAIELNKILDTIPQREKLVIEHRYGLNGYECKTLEDITKILGVSIERIRQIEAKGLRRLRNPSRCKRLTEYVA